MFSWVRGKKFKGESKKFLKNCQLTSYAIIFDQTTFFPMIKLVFRGKREFYLLLKRILKDRVLLKRTQSSIEIDVIAVKKHISF